MSDPSSSSSSIPSFRTAFTSSTDFHSTSTSTSTPSQSYIIADDSLLSSSASPVDNSGADDELDSLPSSSDTSSEGDDRYASDAQEEWEASLEQLQLMLTMVIVPYAGKYFGRKFAYWSWKRYMEWLHPVKVQVTSPGAFRAAGAVAAAAL